MINLQKFDSDRILNITNGDYFNKYFISKFGGEAVPLCEVMMDGDTINEIYSDNFIQLRSSEIGVCVEEYRSKMYVFDKLNIDPNRYSELRLWFGNDTFCQMNLLMLLGYLEKINYRNKVTLNIIDDATLDVIESNIEVLLGIYRKLYNEILVLRKNVQAVGVLSQKAINLYFDYNSQEGKLARLVKDNSDKDDMHIVRLLLENSSEYGLSDIQAKELVNKFK